MNTPHPSPCNSAIVYRILPSTVSVDFSNFHGDGLLFCDGSNGSVVSEDVDLWRSVHQMFGFSNGLRHSGHFLLCWHI
jgi:hypothetical protein